MCDANQLPGFIGGGLTMALLVALVLIPAIEDWVANHNKRLAAQVDWKARAERAEERWAYYVQATGGADELPPKAIGPAKGALCAQGCIYAGQTKPGTCPPGECQLGWPHK